MGRYLFMQDLLSMFSKGIVFRKVSAVALRVIAVFITIVALVLFILDWKIVFKLPASGILGGLIFQMLFVVAIYMVVHTLLIRANEIINLPFSDYTVIPIISIFLKLVGEIYAWFSSLIAVAGGMLIWFAGGYGGYLLRDLMPFLPFAKSGGATFWGGIIFMFTGLLSAFIILMFFYWLSESTLVLVDLANNAKDIREIIALDKEQEKGEEET
jgi:hypothetical protein